MTHLSGLTHRWRSGRKARITLVGVYKFQRIYKVMCCFVTHVETVACPSDCAARRVRGAEAVRQVLSDCL
jgi:hypothetical protein